VSLSDDHESLRIRTGVSIVSEVNYAGMLSATFKRYSAWLSFDTNDSVSIEFDVVGALDSQVWIDGVLQSVSPMLLNASEDPLSVVVLVLSPTVSSAVEVRLSTDGNVTLLYEVPRLDEPHLSSVFNISQLWTAPAPLGWDDVAGLDLFCLWSGVSCCASSSCLPAASPASPRSFSLFLRDMGLDGSLDQFDFSAITTLSILDLSRNSLSGDIPVLSSSVLEADLSFNPNLTLHKDPFAQASVRSSSIAAFVLSLFILITLLFCFFG